MSTAATPIEMVLPTGRKITARRLKSADRRIAMDQIIADKPGIGADLLFVELGNYLPKLALVTDDGRPADSDPAQRMPDWEIIDEEFYLYVFRQIHSLSEADGKRAEDLAKSLRPGA